MSNTELMLVARIEKDPGFGQQWRSSIQDGLQVLGPLEAISEAVDEPWARRLDLLANPRQQEVGCPLYMDKVDFAPQEGAYLARRPGPVEHDDGPGSLDRMTLDDLPCPVTNPSGAMLVPNLIE